MPETLEVIYDGQTQRIHTERLKPGVQGNIQTLGHMGAMVRRAAHDVGIENFVKSCLLADVPPHDDLAEIDACFKFARNAIKWRRDKVDTERIADTRSTIKLQWGDCGDKSILLCTFLAIIGHTPYFVAMSQVPPTTPKDFEFDHVYVGVRHKGKHYPLDPTPETAPSGWEAAGYGRTMVDFWSGQLKLVRLP